MTLKVCPVTWPACGDTRNATAAAISSGSANRPMGMLALHPFTTSVNSGRARRSRTAALLVTPGDTTLTVTPLGPTSLAIALLNATIPALHAE